ncbi:MAG: FecR domain-containing protein [Desulforhopalus sp.]
MVEDAGSCQRQSFNATKNQEKQVMKPLSSILFCAIFLLCSPHNSIAQFSAVGIIKNVSGDVFITTSQTTTNAVPNMQLIQGDSIRTGPNSSVGLIFEDDTVVALGPNSEILIESFVFNPLNKELSFITRMMHGTFSFITGQIAKLAPKKVKLETPDATLGVRGTKILVKID